MAIIRVFTKAKKAEDELRRTQKFLDAVIENIPVPIMVKEIPSSASDARNCHITLINRACEEFFGVPRQQIIGKTNGELYPKERADFIVAHDNETLQSDQPVLIPDHLFVTPGNGTRLITLKKIAIRDDDGKPHLLLSVCEDVTEQRRGEQRIMHMAHFDTLTDLPNRATFNETLDVTINHAATTGELFAILSIDLDGFKETNDTYGHLVGDGLLREVARRLQAAAGEAFLARLGGDEFAIIVADGAQPAAALAECLFATLVNDIEVEGHRLKLGMSIGVAIYPTDGTDAKILMINADAALYRAKAETRGMAMFFEPEMSARLRERHALQEDLRSAIDRGELLLHYQPQVKMSGETIGFEALARWQCPKRGMVPPGTFIPIAEESSLIIRVGEWVLREACPNLSASEDYLFFPKYKNRSSAKRIAQRQFNALLKRCALKENPMSGYKHSLYSLRHTAICMRLTLSKGKVNIYSLAKNAGTSVDQIERFYARNLPISEELVRNLQTFGND